jgi:hypothetical protein
MPEFPATGPIYATIRTAAGSVRVTAEDRDTVDVQVEPGTAGEPARTAAAETLVEMTGDQLLVETPQPRGFILRRTPPVNVRVRLPRGSHLMLRSASADHICDGQYGSADVNTASGDLRIEHVTGELKRHASSGDLQFGRIDGDLTVNSASGDIRGDAVGGDVAAKSASGDLTIGAVGGSARITTASGDIKLGNLVTGTTRINAASGDVQLGINEGTALWMDVNSVSGTTRSDLAVGDAPPDGPGTQLSLQIRTVSGDVRIFRAVTAPAWPGGARPAGAWAGAAPAADEPQD